jgi:pimeloyl-ACP methyl ester carboxylesterase
MPLISFLPSYRPSHETVLCIHASATSARAWEALMAPLRGRFEVLMPERLGYAGAERWPAGASASLDAEARHLAPLLNAHPHGVHLVAHSFGAAVALQIALRWPSRVKSLTLYEPSRFALLSGAAECAEANDEIRQVAAGVERAVAAGRDGEAAALFVDYWSGEGAWSGLDERHRRSIARQMPKVRAEFEAAFADRVPLAAYEALTMPLCLIGGDASPRPSRLIVERIARQVPHAQTVLLHGVGHMGPLTHASRVSAYLPAWLRAQPEPMAA